MQSGYFSSRGGGGGGGYFRNFMTGCAGREDTPYLYNGIKFDIKTYHFNII